MDKKQIRLLSTGNLQISPGWAGEAEHIQLDVIPFIRIEQRLTLGLVRDIRKWSTEKHTVIFTSKQAVRLVGTLLPHTPLGWRIYCINGATKREILTWWREATIIDTAPNGKELAGKIIAGPKESSILFFCSNQRLDEIPSRMAEAQLPLKEIQIYETISTPSVIENKYHGIFFFSPSAVHSFFSVNQIENTLFFSIGETTTAALEKYIQDKRKIITADRPSKFKMLEVARSYYQ